MENDIPIDKIDMVIVEPMRYRKYGWHKDSSDSRDYVHSPKITDNLQRKFSLKDVMPPVLDQGKLGSCTANGIANCIRRLDIIEKIENNKPRSRLFIYFNERKMENTVGEDSGASIRDGIKSVNRWGSCFEETWPYDINMFTEEPIPQAYAEAKKHRTVRYHKVKQTEEDITNTIANGLPVIFGFAVFDTIENPQVMKTGIVPMPTSYAKQIGGHCVILTGYDKTYRLFQFQNSWGESFGDDGYGYISYDYVLNPKLANDFWVIQWTE